jgi:hypothetical protein
MATDNFNRTNVDPIGGNWTAITGTNRIVSYQFKGRNSPISNYSYWNANSFSNNQYSKATIKWPSWSSVLVRASSGSNWYELQDTFPVYPDELEFSLWKMVNGSKTLLSSEFIVSGVPDYFGVIMEIRIVGTTISAYINNIYQAETTDATFSSGSAGAGGLYTDFVLDNWEGGNVSNQPTTTLGTTPTVTTGTTPTTTLGG